MKDLFIELGRTPTANIKTNEIGASGMGSATGYLDFSPLPELRWPSAYSIYNRLRRTDPEVSIARLMMNLLGRSVKLEVRPGTLNPNQDDLDAANYIQTMFSEIEGGPSSLIDTIVSYVPFMGFSLWEQVYGIRNKRKYGKWISRYDDGLPALKKLAWRDHSTWFSWIFNETGKVDGFTQMIYKGKKVGKFEIPIDKCLHLTFGDAVNPEGLTPLESLYRLERMKYGFEVIFGLGAQHTSGYLSVEAERKITDGDKTLIRDAAANIMKAQEGNYALFPQGFKGKIMDSNFAAAENILEAIRFYGILKLQLFMMQFVSIATTSGGGSYSAIKDSSDLAILSFNSMMAGFANGINEQVTKPLFRNSVVERTFPNLTDYPIVYFSQVEKPVNLSELGVFLKHVSSIIEFTPADILAIRRKSSFLPEVNIDSNGEEGEGSAEINKIFNRSNSEVKDEFVSDN